MLTTNERRTATSPAPPSRPRLRLQPDLSARTLLDGGWWPRSADPVAELPGLILAIDRRRGPITQIMLGRAGWDASRLHRLRVDGPAGRRVVRLGWFETMPAGLLTATARAGRTDLLTVPPPTSEPAGLGGHGPGRPGRQPHPRPRPAGRHHPSRPPGGNRAGQHPAEHLGLGGRAAPGSAPA